MAVYGYIRVSTEDQAKDDRSSLELQERRIMGWAMMHGSPIDRTFRDEVTGIRSFSARPQGSILAKLLKPGDWMVASKMDRAFRSAIDALMVAQGFEDRGINLVLLDMGTDSVTRSSQSKFFFGILALVAELERSTIKDRQRGGQVEKRKSGGHIGGPPPFGFVVEGRGRAARLVADERQQEAIALARRLRAEKKSLRAISAAIAAAHGIRVSHKAVNKALARKEELVK